MEWLALLVIIVILGALAGGNAFGQTVRRGCGCIVILVAIVIAGALIGTWSG